MCLLQGRLALHLAAAGGEAAVVSAVLAANPAGTAEPDKDERLPLHCAVAAPADVLVSVIQVLLQRGGREACAHTDRRGDTPLQVRCKLRASPIPPPRALQSRRQLKPCSFRAQLACLRVDDHPAGPAAALTVLAGNPDMAAVPHPDTGQLPIHRLLGAGTLLHTHTQPTAIGPSRVSSCGGGPMHLIMWWRPFLIMWCMGFAGCRSAPVAEGLVARLVAAAGPAALSRQDKAGRTPMHIALSGTCRAASLGRKALA